MALVANLRSPITAGLSALRPCTSGGRLSCLSAPSWLSVHPSASASRTKVFTSSHPCSPAGLFEDVSSQRLHRTDRPWRQRSDGASTESEGHASSSMEKTKASLQARLEAKAQAAGAEADLARSVPKPAHESSSFGAQTVDVATAGLSEADIRSVVASELPGQIDKQLQDAMASLTKQMADAVAQDIAEATRAAGDAARSTATAEVAKALSASSSKSLGEADVRKIVADASSKSLGETEVRKMVEAEVAKQLKSRVQEAIAPMTKDLLQLQMALKSVEATAQASPGAPAVNESDLRQLLDRELPKRLDAHSKAVLTPLTDELRQVVASETSEVTKAVGEASRVAAEAASREATLIAKMKEIEGAAAELRGHLKHNPGGASSNSSVDEQEVERLVEARLAQKLAPLREDVRQLEAILRQQVSSESSSPVGLGLDMAHGARRMWQAVVSLLIVGVLVLIAMDVVASSEDSKAGTKPDAEKIRASAEEAREVLSRRRHTKRGEQEA